MSLKKLGAALFAVLALGAVMASSAFAAPSTVESHWYVKGSVLSGSTAVRCHGNGTFTLSSTISGLPVKVTATGVECLSGSVLSQNGTMAEDSGKLTFTDATVDEPAGCTVLNGTIETESLKTRIEEEGTGGPGQIYDRFEPAAGETSKFATVKIRSCAAEGNYPVTGFIFGSSPNATGIEKTAQPLEFDTTTDAISGLKLGGNAATLHGEMVNELVSGSVFGSKK